MKIVSELLPDKLITWDKVDPAKQVIVRVLNKKVSLLACILWGGQIGHVFLPMIAKHPYPYLKLSSVFVEGTFSHFTGAIKQLHPEHSGDFYAFNSLQELAQAILDNGWE